MKPLFTSIAKLLGSIFSVGALVLVANGAFAANPIHTNCSGSHCTLDAIWMVFQNNDVNNPVTQQTSTSMNTDTTLVASQIKNQSNQTSSFLPGDTLTVPINASGELISTGAQFYDSPPVHFRAGGKVRAIMDNIVSCSQTIQAIYPNITGFSGTPKCNATASVNDPLTGTWTDTWTTSAGNKLSCTTSDDGKTATCASDSTIAPGPVTITLTRTIKDLVWSANDVWLNRRGMPTMNLHPFYSAFGYTYLFAGWDTLHDAPMTSSATVQFVKKVPATVDLKVSSSPTGTFTDGPITIPSGTQAYLRWTSSNATSCSMSGGIVASGLPTSGLNYPTGAITSATSYTVTCAGPGGTSTPDTVNVVVNSSTPTPSPSPSVSPSATPSPTPSASPTTNPINHPPVSVAAISADGGSYGSNIVVTKGKPVAISLSAAGSSDPDGWTTPILGVAQGGKCEWNSDLNQGTPTFETTVASPSTPNACNISLGSLTFNDTPGTYTYNLLRVTDASGAKSVNDGQVSITVINGPTPTPSASPSASPTASPSNNFGDFHETR